MSHETIYQSLFVQGRGELRRELARCLRSGRTVRRPRGRVEKRFGSLSGRQLMAPRGLRKYAAAVLSGIRPQRITGDVMRSPGIAILDAAHLVRWTYEGTALGDYPALDEVLEAVRLVAPFERGVMAETGVRDLVAASQAVLDANWTGASTVSSRTLYPHQWSWDSAFISIGRRWLD